MNKATLILLAGLLATPAYADNCISTAGVSQLYPTSQTLPENLLRFYIYFDTEMSRENPLASIHLLDAQGQKIDGAFLSNKVDLWSPDTRRLTVLFDPGRVKTGLVAHNQLGRALESGQQYTLLIDPSLQTANGCDMAQPYRKTFQATDADFTAPDLAEWRVAPPKAGTQDWLEVTLNGPQDHVSLAYRLRIMDAKGHIISGRIDLKDQETVWRFKPQTNWEAANYTIQVNDSLEDIAGNRLTGSFEQPISQPSDRQYFLEFKPR